MQALPMIVVSNNTLFRNGIQKVVEKAEHMTIHIVAECTSFAEADRFLNGTYAKVLLFDDSLPRTSNLVQEVKRMIEHHPGLAIIMIAQRPTVSLVNQLVDAGVSSIIHRDDEMEYTLNQTIIMASKGGLSLSPSITRLSNVQPVPDMEIEQRDIDILQLLAEGYQTKEISVHLGLHPKSIYRILQNFGLPPV